MDLYLWEDIPLYEHRRLTNIRYFDFSPTSFKESAILERFLRFIEGWCLPPIHKGIIYKGWTFQLKYVCKNKKIFQNGNILQTFRRTGRLSFAHFRPQRAGLPIFQVSFKI